MRSSAAAAAGPSIASLSGCSSDVETEKIAHRYIDQDACIGCGECVSLCPMGAISLDETSSIDPDECAECGVCSRSRICPADAIRQGDLKWPRVLREVFSNPLAEHETTGVQGRGTPGIKANDSENRYQRGQIGVFVELGRPVLGARFYDVEKVVRHFTVNGYTPVKENPVSDLIRDPSTGVLKKEILNEKVISCVVEFVIPQSDSGKLQKMCAELGQQVKTVFNVCVALRAAENGESPFYRIFPPDAFCLPQAKVNIGLAQNLSSVKAG
jgi:ferredoxin